MQFAIKAQCLTAQNTIKLKSFLKLFAVLTVVWTEKKKKYSTVLLLAHVLTSDLIFFIA